MKITSKSQIRKGTKFNLLEFNKMFCEKEKKKYKVYEYPKFKNKLFWKKSVKFENKGKILIISGPARSGNHLLLSLIDGHPSVQYHPGEDDFLRSIFTEVNKSEGNLIKKLKSKNNWKFILSLSGQAPFGKKKGFNKWKKLFYSNSKNYTWSGKQKEGSGHIYDYQGIKPKIRYYQYENYLKTREKEISSSNNFLDIFSIYLDAIKKLYYKKTNNLKYDHVWFGSGLRRELKFLLERNKNIVCLVPIRKFETFYYSYSMSRHKTKKIQQNALNDLWEHWRHKVIDYLILKKKYPKNIIILQYEDLIYNTKFTIQKISKKLGIKFSEKMLVPTIFNKRTKGNSTYGRSNKDLGKIYRSSAEYSFPKKILTDEYRQIIQVVKKYSV